MTAVSGGPHPLRNNIHQNGDGSKRPTAKSVQDNGLKPGNRS